MSRSRNIKSLYLSIMLPLQNVYRINRLSISFHIATDFNYKLTYRDRRMITQNHAKAHKLLPNYYDNADILKLQTLFLFIVVYISRYIEE